METIETTMGSNGTKKNQLKSSRIEVGRGIGQTNPRHRQNINNLTSTQQFKLIRNTSFRQKLERLLRTTAVQRKKKKTEKSSD